MNDLVAKVRRAADETARVQRELFDTHAETVVECARALATALGADARVFTFGNGGSACDAQHAAVELSHPIFEKRKAFSAIALPGDVARMSAVGNDRDYALVFSDALRVHARRGDAVMAFSTSGNSASVLRGLGAARELGLLTIGFAGRDGGRMQGACDWLFVVPSFSVHRIQEAHQTLMHVLWDVMHVLRGEEDVLR